MHPIHSFAVELRPRQYVFPLVMAALKAAGIRGHFEIGVLIMSYLPVPLLPAMRSLYPNRIGASIIDVMLKVPIDTDTQIMIRRYFNTDHFCVLSSICWLRLDMDAIFKHQAWHVGLAPGYEEETWDLDDLEMSMLVYIKYIAMLYTVHGFIKPGSLDYIMIRGNISVVTFFRKVWDMH
jgi:hypothetical protein